MCPQTIPGHSTLSVCTDFPPKLHVIMTSLSVDAARLLVMPFSFSLFQRVDLPNAAMSLVHPLPLAALSMTGVETTLPCTATTLPPAPLEPSPGPRTWGWRTGRRSRARRPQGASTTAGSTTARRAAACSPTWRTLWPTVIMSVYQVSEGKGFFHVHNHGSQFPWQPFPW